MKNIWFNMLYVGGFMYDALGSIRNRKKRISYRGLGKSITGRSGAEIGIICGNLRRY